MEAARAVIMAGGKSERMRASGGSAHKALMRVHDITLLEWNLRLLAFYGFRDVVVAVSRQDPAVAAAAAAVAELVKKSGVTVTVYKEPEPLGNIGAAREVIGNASDLLILYVDNLATIDLRNLLDFHRAGKFAMTVASHVEPFQIPFGELTVAGDQVTAYAEKPTYRIRVSSGTCVISKRACRTMQKGRSIGASALFAELSARGERVGAFLHDEPWIDINDVATLQRAQDFVSQHIDIFERMKAS